MWVCVCVSLRPYTIYLKKLLTDFDELSRMIDNDKRQVPFEDEFNRFIRTEVKENSYLYYFLLRPFDNIFWGYFPFFIIGEVKCNKLLKKTP